MKSSSSHRRVRPIRAKASAINAAEFEDYGPEPNMKLSHAFMVVLALHIIAVGGLFAFNKVKASHTTFSAKAKTEHALAKEATASETASEAASTTAPVSATTAASKIVASPAVLPKIAALKTAAVSAIVAHQQAQAPAPMNAAAPAAAPVANKVLPSGPSGMENPPPASSAPAVAAVPSEKDSETVAAVDTAKEYTIVKGDNPYKVAKKFHVSYDALMKLNNITDPRKIQIGQKLKIPAAAPHKVVKRHQ